MKFCIYIRAELDNKILTTIMSNNFLTSIICEMCTGTMAQIKEHTKCSCDCIMKKDRNYILNNSSKVDKTQYIKTYIHNLERWVDLMEDNTEELKEANAKLKRKIVELETPPAYDLE